MSTPPDRPEGMSPEPPTTVHVPHALSPDETRSRGESIDSPGNGSGSTGTTYPIPRIPNYEILGELGRGGMGVVYRARQLSLNRIVALKMILGSDRASVKELARFQAEAEAVANLNHPNVIQIFEVSGHQGVPFFTLELCPGGTLAEWAAERPMSPREAAEVVERIARGVACAHTHGIVHRDLKPANVLFAEDGTPKVTDFGLAKKVEGGEELTRSGAVMGTPQYMAPEQAGGMSKRVGPPADVWALGAILYRLLTGRPPFQGDTPMEVLLGVLRDDPPTPRSLNPTVHRDLEVIALKCLSKEPQRRYVSAQALADDLGRFLAGESILARPDGLTRKLWRRVRRYPTAVASSLAVVAAVAAAAYLFLDADKTRRVAELNRTIEAALGEGQMDPAHWQFLADAADELGRIDPSQAGAADGRVDQQFAERFRARLRLARLSEDDLAELRRTLDWFRGRDPVAADALAAELEGRVSAWQTVAELVPPFERASEVFPEGVRIDAGSLTHELESPAVRTQLATPTSVEVEATFDEGWQETSRVGVWLNLTDGGREKSGYAFWLVTRVERDQIPLSFADAKAVGFPVRAAITRSGAPLRTAAVPVGDGPLSLTAKREGDRLTFHVNGVQAASVYDARPLAGTDTGTLGLDWPAGVGVSRLSVRTRTLATTVSPLERGDVLFTRGEFSAALVSYQEQALVSESVEVRQEAEYRSALCLLELGREEQADDILASLVAADGDRWPLLATLQLLLLKLRQDQLAEVGPLIETVRTRYDAEELAAYIPEDIQKSVLRVDGAATMSEFLFADDRTIERYTQKAELADVFGQPLNRIAAQSKLIRLYGVRGEIGRGGSLARSLLGEMSEKVNGLHSVYYIRDAVWMMSIAGFKDEALLLVDRIIEAVKPSELFSKYICYVLIDRARLLIACEDFSGAEREIDTFLKVLSDDPPHYEYFAAAHLLKGLLRERAGDHDAAMRAWKTGFRDTRADRAIPDAGEGLVLFLILGSLTGELTDRQAELCQQAILGKMGENSFAKRIASTLGPSPEVLRQMWRSPRGREYAEKWVARTLPPAEHYRVPLVLASVEKIRRDAFGGELTPEQDEVVWQAVFKGVSDFVSSKLTPTRLMQVGLAWKGTTNFLGWAGAAPHLEPSLRGPIAYVLGHRYQRLKKPADAEMFLRTAIKDAAEGSVLRLLAEEDLRRLKNEKEPGTPEAGQTNGPK